MLASWEKDTLLQYKKRSREKTYQYTQYTSLPSSPAVKWLSTFLFSRPPPPFTFPGENLRAAGERGQKRRPGGEEDRRPAAATMAKGEEATSFTPLSPPGPAKEPSPPCLTRWKSRHAKTRIRGAKKRTLEGPPPKKSDSQP